MVDDLNLTNSIVYDHCHMLKKAMDDTNWAEEAADFKKRFLCKDARRIWQNS